VRASTLFRSGGNTPGGRRSVVGEGIDLPNEIDRRFVRLDRRCTARGDLAHTFVLLQLYENVHGQRTRTTA